MFVNRIQEEERIRNALTRSISVLLAVYGRRRCGKSTLLKRIISDKDVYYVADMREKSLQISSLAKNLDIAVPGFSSVHYPDWHALFSNLNNSLKESITLCIDEFPYLVKNDPGLPSILQNIVDNKINKKYNLILCGSSQQMMEDMVLNSSSPLYGRCDEIINIKPMTVKWFCEYFKTDPVAAVEGYSVFGGVPRYWELLKEKGSLPEAVKYHILDKDGILHKEPEMLFHDEMRTSVMAYSILCLAGMGCNRLSEIASRLEKPATQLNRPLRLLVDLGYLRRETPFNTSGRSTKKSLYKIADPFMNFYFRFVVPNKSRLEYGMHDNVWSEIKRAMDHYTSGVWEELCRDAIPFLRIGNQAFNPSKRWWGNGIDRRPVEVDIIAESEDKKTLLIGEAKWSDSVPVKKVYDELMSKAQNLPFAYGKDLLPVLFLKKQPTSLPGDITIFTPRDIIDKY